MPAVIIPNPLLQVDANLATVESNQLPETLDGVSVTHQCMLKPLVDVKRISTFTKLVKIYHNVLLFINKLKLHVRNRSPVRFSKLCCLSTDELYSAANVQAILREQHVHFKEVFQYFNLKSKRLVDMPPIIGQLNIFRDSAGTLRVKSEIKLWKNESSTFPILLAKTAY